LDGEEVERGGDGADVGGEGHGGGWSVSE
jgi:hypothetical protein